ncbi:MAG: orotidine-5'-phosphate decarboxylase [Bradymonadales bacterium]|nr:MAG: orotidine-5'-phosphate decarboxylase [Bradymonadales bacterium]
MAEPRGKSLKRDESLVSQRLVLALDQSWEDCRPWLTRLGGRVWGFKVGSVLYTERGPEVLSELVGAGFRVFLDLKWHDIPNTVFRAAETAKSLGVSWATIHAAGGRRMMEEASRLQTKDFQLVAVTYLTSLESADLSDLGFSFKKTEEVVSHFVDLAYKSGIRHFVCSAQDLKSLALPKRYPDASWICPGIRLAGSAAKDQRRLASPREALEWGASYLVIGRTLTAEVDWEQKWQSLVSTSAETL